MPYPSPREAILSTLSGHPLHCPKGYSGMQTSDLEGQRGPGQLLHFPPTKSQKWQKVKAHQHVKTLVKIKTIFFFFCEISSWERGRGLINGEKARQRDPNSLCLHN